MNVAHTGVRNLHVRSVEALLQLRQGLSHYFQSAVNFEPSDGMLRKFNARGSEEEENVIISIELK